MTITASALVPQETEAFKGDLWEPPAYFLHDWGQGTVLATSWRTAVTSSRAVSEQRFGLVNKPYRTLGMVLSAFKQDQVQRLRSLLMRMGKARTPLPLVPDRTKLTGIVDPATFVYSGDFTNRRFFVGGWALAADLGKVPIIDDFQLRKITAVTDTQITLDGDLKEAIVSPSIEFHNMVSAAGPVTSITLPNAPANVASVLIAFVSSQSTDLPTSVVWGAQAFTFVASQVSTSGPTKVVSAWVLQLPGSPVPDTRDVIATWGGSRFGLQLSTIVVRGADQTGAVDASGTGHTASNGTDPVMTITTVTGDDLILAYASESRDPSDGSDLDEITVPPGKANVDQILSGSQLTRSIASAAAVLSALYTVTWGWSTPPIGAWHVTMIAVAIKGKLAGGLAKKHIYPVIEAELDFEHQAEPVHAQLARLSMLAIEEPGASALDPLAVPGTLPSGFPTHTQDGVTQPVLTAPVDWRRVIVGTSRSGSRAQVGIGSATDVFGNRPRVKFLMPYTRLSRADGFDLLRFFDSRGGRLHPFWLVSPTIDFDLLEIHTAGLWVKVRAVGAEFDWAFAPYLALKRISDGTILIRKITSVIRAGGEDQLFLDVAVPVNRSATDHRATTAHLVRFNTDEFREHWITDEHLQVELAALELVSEKDVVVTLHDLCPGGVGLPYVHAPGCPDLCVTRCGTDQVGGCCACFDGNVSLTCHDYELQQDPCDCQTGCILILTAVFSLPPVSCIAGVARWDNGDQFVELDTNTKLWSYGLGSDDCFGEVDPLLCICDFEDCDDIETHECDLYTKFIPCKLPSGDCNHKPAIRISCPECDNANALCA